MAQMARHTYGDWIRHKSGMVAVIATVDLKNYLSRIEYVNGDIVQCTIFDYDTITEYEFFQAFDPSKCGPTIEQLAYQVSDAFRVNVPMPGDDWFTGGKMKHAMKPPGEDLFRCDLPSSI